MTKKIQRSTAAREQRRRNDLLFYLQYALLPGCLPQQIETACPATEFDAEITTRLFNVWQVCQAEMPSQSLPLAGILTVNIHFFRSPLRWTPIEGEQLLDALAVAVKPLFLGSSDDLRPIDLPLAQVTLTLRSFSAFRELLESSSGKDFVAQALRKAQSESTNQLPQHERSPMPPSEEEANETEQPGFVEREQSRRGRPKQQRPSILWQEVKQIAEEVNDQQAQAVKRLQALLVRLTGAAGTPAENKILANTVNMLARCLGCELTDDGQIVDVRFHGRAFEARSTATGRETLISSAGFPHLTARAIRPTEGNDLSAWLNRELAKVEQQSGGVGSPQ